MTADRRAAEALFDALLAHDDARCRCGSLQLCDGAKLDAIMRYGAQCRAEAQQWQPIETAPKNGTQILLLFPAGVDCGGWTSQVDQGAEYEGQSGAPSAGWWSVNCHEAEPTHWMPLPVPPPAPTDAKS